MGLFSLLANIFKLETISLTWGTPVKCTLCQTVKGMGKKISLSIDNLDHWLKIFCKHKNLSSKDELCYLQTTSITH